MFFVMYHVFPILLCSSLSLYELYKAKKTLTEMEKEIQRFIKLSKEIQDLKDRFCGLENVTIRALDQHIDRVHIQLDVLEKKFSSFSKKSCSDVARGVEEVNNDII